MKKVLGIIAAIILVVVVVSLFAASQNKKQNDTSNTARKQSSTSNKSTTTTNNTNQQSQTHTVVYSFGVDKGSMSSADMQNVGLSWGLPSNGNNQIPTNILSAVQQIQSGVYTVTFNVTGKINNYNLKAGVNNSEPDATLDCTIEVDNNEVSTEQAPPNGNAECAGVSSLEYSGTN